MPLFFSVWLERLNDEQAKEMWNYLDGKPGVEEEIIEVVCRAHQSMVEADERHQ